ncbi:group II intron reverse transcriptase/maturase, partial [Cohnella cellulosilytica]
MNVAETEEKYSQLPEREGSVQKVRAEHEGYAGAYGSERTTKNNAANASESKKGMLEEVVSVTNLNEAYKRVKANKGTHGVDGMKVDELLQYLKENGEAIQQAILGGKYRPNPVRRVEIPKEDG